MLRFVLKIQDGGPVNIGMEPIKRLKTIDIDVPDLEAALREKIPYGEIELVGVEVLDIAG